MPLRCIAVVKNPRREIREVISLNDANGLLFIGWSLLRTLKKDGKDGEYVVFVMLSPAMVISEMRTKVIKTLALMLAHHDQRTKEILDAFVTHGKKPKKKRVIL